MRLPFYFLFFLFVACTPAANDKKASQDADAEPLHMQESQPAPEQDTASANVAPPAATALPPAQNGAMPEMKKVAADSKLTVKVFENKEGISGFGYDVLSDGKTLIHQPHLPAVSGNKGFSTKEDAEKTAALMLMKIQKGIMPPTISIEELDSLNIRR